MRLHISRLACVKNFRIGLSKHSTTRNAFQCFFDQLLANRRSKKPAVIRDLFKFSVATNQVSIADRLFKPTGFRVLDKPRDLDSEECQSQSLAEQVPGSASHSTSKNWKLRLSGSLPRDALKPSRIFGVGRNDKLQALQDRRGLWAATSSRVLF